MICRSCGTEIADKAIVCYRCGAGTKDPVRKPVEVRRSRRLVPVFVLIVSLLAAIYAGYGEITGNSVIPPGYGWPIVIAIVVELIVIVARLLRTPRRR